MANLGIAGYQPNQQAQLQQQRSEQQSQNLWNAVNYGLELKKQKQQSEQFRELLKLKKMQAESDEDKLKFDRQLKTMEMQLKVLEIGGTILEKNPTISQEDYVGSMEPFLQQFAGTDQKKEAIMDTVKSMHEHFKPPTKSVMTEEQAREAALSGGQIPEDTRIIADDKFTGTDAKALMEAYDAENPRSAMGGFADFVTPWATAGEKKRQTRSKEVYGKFAQQFGLGNDAAQKALGGETYPKPDDVAQADWDAATDAQKKAFLKGRGAI